ncbi:hypothetical protein CEXT_471391 [Caerostris extrusa]|uniref:Uncharacterized protein n=1 Tax=Caerostris extrusa TaxID=172846 RepID=A0AAV4U291_CAEEX|nr:hypothetical protein CEXT_471391 [Caerostris extrusa]
MGVAVVARRCVDHLQSGRGWAYRAQGPTDNKRGGPARQNVTLALVSGARVYLYALLPLQLHNVLLIRQRAPWFGTNTIHRWLVQWSVSVVSSDVMAGHFVRA